MYKAKVKFKSAIERIKSKTHYASNGCWEYTGFRLRGQHGRMTFNSKTWYVHRLAWTELNGPVPSNIQVCHKCDNPPCWNPEHLFLGTNDDNVHDCVQKKRHAFGARNGSARLTDDLVVKISNSYVPGKITMQQIADTHGISLTLAYNIIRGKMWKHVSRTVNPNILR